MHIPKTVCFFIIRHNKDGIENFDTSVAQIFKTTVLPKIKPSEVLARTPDVKRKCDI